MPSDKTIIAICGLGGSGKDTTIQLLFEMVKGGMVHMRDVVEEEIRKRGMPITNESLREVATSMRKELGYDIMAKRSIPHVKKALERHSLVIINSIKDMEETELYEKELKENILLLAVYASPRTRFERLSRRGLKWDMKDYKSFVWRDMKELGWGLGSAISLADYTIINEGSMKDLKESVSRFLDFVKNTWLSYAGKGEDTG